MSKTTDEDDKIRQKTIRNLARKQHAIVGQLEIDPDAIVSEGDDNGAYVAAWVWVNFHGHPDLDKNSRALRAGEMNTFLEI